MASIQQVMMVLLGGVTTIVSDSFNRADSGTLGVADSGQTWQLTAIIPLNAGTFSIVSNQAVYTHGTSSTMAFINTLVSDVTVQATNVTSKPSDGLWFRGTGQNGYLFINNSNSSYRCFKVQSGTFTQLFDAGAGTPTPASGDVLKVVLLGDSITFYVNGSSIGNISDSTFSTQSAYGFYGSITAASDNGAWDSFLVTSP